MGGNAAFGGARSAQTKLDILLKALERILKLLLLVLQLFDAPVGLPQLVLQSIDACTSSAAGSSPESPASGPTPGIYGGVRTCAIC